MPIAGVSEIISVGQGRKEQKEWKERKRRLVYVNLSVCLGSSVKTCVKKSGQLHPSFPGNKQLALFLVFFSQCLGKITPHSLIYSQCSGMKVQRCTCGPQWDPAFLFPKECRIMVRVGNGILVVNCNYQPPAYPPPLFSLSLSRFNLCHTPFFRFFFFRSLWSGKSVGRLAFGHKVEPM